MFVNKVVQIYNDYPQSCQSFCYLLFLMHLLTFFKRAGYKKAIKKVPIFAGEKCLFLELFLNNA
jgi:hypothetical protein